MLALALREHSALLLALAYAGFFLNLFNLIPITPFDGGRIVAILSPKVWFVGVPVLVGAFLLSPSPMFLMILLLLAPTIYRSAPRRPGAARRRPTTRATTRCRWRRGCATPATTCCCSGSCA